MRKTKRMRTDDAGDAGDDGDDGDDGHAVGGIIV